MLQLLIALKVSVSPKLKRRQFSTSFKNLAQPIVDWIRWQTDTSVSAFFVMSHDDKMMTIITTKIDK